MKEKTVLMLVGVCHLIFLSPQGWGESLLYLEEGLLHQEEDLPLTSIEKK